MGLPADQPSPRGRWFGTIIVCTIATARAHPGKGTTPPLARLPLVLHERLGYWARHLRPLLLGWPIRWVESRSATDLESALAGAACPIVVLDLARRPRAGLEDLDRAVQAAPKAMVLVVDPESHEGVALLARELGATHVISGVATPPTVAALLERWLPLALRRTEREGWSRAPRPEPEPEPWNWLAPYLGERSAATRISRS